MKFALNYSPQAVRLLAEGRIDIDLFKCPPWPDLVAAARAVRPVYIHFDLKTGDGSIARADWDAIEALMEETGTPFVNVHLHAEAGHFPDQPVDSRLPSHLRAVADRFIRELNMVTNRFGPERVIVENVIYRGAHGKFPYASIAPEVITRVVRETGCGLLLDTAHARLTTLELGTDPLEYLAQLPGDRLCELHVTGLGYPEPGGVVRDHMPMQAEDWSVVEWVLSRIRAERWSAPRIVALEYGGIGPLFEWRSDSEALAQQAPRLRELLT